MLRHANSHTASTLCKKKHKCYDMLTDAMGILGNENVILNVMSYCQTGLLFLQQRLVYFTHAMLARLQHRYACAHAYRDLYLSPFHLNT